MRTLTRVLALALVLGASATARADDGDASGASALGSPRRPSSAAPHLTHDPSQFALDVSVSTMLPLVVGGVVGFEMPGHIVARVGGGTVPAAYVDAVSSVAMGWGAYDAHAAQMASVVLNDAMFLEMGLAIRPAGTPGIELAVSYVLFWTHRRVDMSQFGLTLPDAGIDVTIDAIHGELAWQSEPVDHVYFRIALGWAQAFDHHVGLAAAGDAATQAALHAQADALAATIGRYAFGPTLGASLGFRI